MNKSILIGVFIRYSQFSSLQSVVTNCLISNVLQVLLYGGQVVSWKNERREELLFMSSKVYKQLKISS